MKLLFHCRDCRGGKGEKALFHVGCEWLAKNHMDTLVKNLEHIPEFGCYKDYCVLVQKCPELEDEIAKLFAMDIKRDMQMFKGCVKSGYTLAAKWAPSKGKSLDKTNPSFLKKLKRELNLNKEHSDMEYRKILTTLRYQLNIVEKSMCDNDWENIDFSKVPSCLLYTSPSPRDRQKSRMPSSA